MILKKQLNIITGVRIRVTTNTETVYNNIFFEAETDTTIIVYDTLKDKYITLEKSSITEIYNEVEKKSIPLSPLTRNIPNEDHRVFHFINEEHEENYEKLLLKWEVAKKDKEYAVAVYILALPLIFDKFKMTFESFETPVVWIADYEYKFNDELAKRFELSQAERDAIVIDYDLTSSMVQLGRLAYHLWNGYDQFSLLDCLSVLDAAHYFALKQALEIRK